MVLVTVQASHAPKLAIKTGAIKPIQREKALSPSAPATGLSSRADRTRPATAGTGRKPRASDNAGPNSRAVENSHAQPVHSDRHALPVSTASDAAAVHRFAQNLSSGEWVARTAAEHAAEQKYLELIGCLRAAFGESGMAHAGKGPNVEVSTHAQSQVHAASVSACAAVNERHIANRPDRQTDEIDSYNELDERDSLGEAANTGRSHDKPHGASASMRHLDRPFAHLFGGATESLDKLREKEQELLRRMAAAQR